MFDGSVLQHLIKIKLSPFSALSDATGSPSRTNALRNVNLGVNSGMTARHGHLTYRVATFDASRVASHAQIGTPLYTWAYTGAGDESATFGITAGESINFTKVIRELVTLGSFTANTQKFFQYYYQVTYKSPASGAPSIYAVGFIPADKLSRFFASNLGFNQRDLAL